MADRTPVEKLLRQTTDIVRAEDLVIEAVRDLMKDEVKKYIRARLDANPALKEELKAAVEDLMEAKIKEGYAMVKLAKAGMKLGLELVPGHLREQFTKDLVSMFQKELAEVMEKSL